MKELMKKVRGNKKGFTLAELLVVVAIIAILVAISIPVFTAQLSKARIATNQANLRAAKAAVVAQFLTEDADSTKAITYDYDLATGTVEESGQTPAGGTTEVTIENPGDTQFTKFSVKVDPTAKKNDTALNGAKITLYAQK